MREAAPVVLGGLGRGVDDEGRDVDPGGAGLRASRDLLGELHAPGGLSHASHAILEAACRVQGIDSGGVYLAEPNGGLRLVAQRGLPEEFVAQISRHCPETAEARYLDHAALAAGAAFPGGRLCLAAGLQAVAVLPVALEGRAVAMLLLASRTHWEIPVAARVALEVMTAPLGGAIARAQAVRRLMEFGWQRPSGPQIPCDLAGLATECLELTRPRWQDEAQRRGRLIQVRTALEGLPPVQGEPAEIREALTNLILNAVDAMPSGGGS